MVGYCGYRSFYMIHPKVNILYKDCRSDLDIFSDLCTPPALPQILEDHYLLPIFYSTRRKPIPRIYAIEVGPLLPFNR